MPVFRDAELALLGATPLTADDPDRVGRFELLGVLGSGGMGRVYLGRAGGGFAAVKVTRPELADDPQFRRRFGHELQTVRRLHAAFTVPLIDGDADAPRPWLATQYAPGISVQEAVTEYGPMPSAAVARLAAGVAAALTAIHAESVIHRDLKPSNVIVALDGPQVIDFGIAHAADMSRLTATGQPIGTPSYMSPEQARTGLVTAASDVFALGGMLTFAATGRAPFGEGSPAEVLFRAIHEQPDLTGLAALDLALRDMVVRCLDKDPARRPGAATLAAELAGDGTAAGPNWPAELQERIESCAALVSKAALTPATDTGSQRATLSWARNRLSPPLVPAPPLFRRRRPLVIMAASLAVVLAAAAGVLASYESGLNRQKALLPSASKPNQLANNRSVPATTGSSALSAQGGTSTPSPGATGTPTTHAYGGAYNPPMPGSTHRPTSGGVLGDINGDGKPDILAVNSSGNLYLYPNTGGAGSVRFGAPSQVGTGWAGYTMAAVVGLYGSGRVGILAIDPSGSLLYYPNTGDSGTRTFGARRLVGSGWTGYQIAGVADVNGSGRPGILAIGPNGNLLYYPATGRSGTSTFGASMNVSSGWSGYKANVADINGDGKPDILAIAPDGNLYLYPNTTRSKGGAITFGARIQVGSGWSGWHAMDVGFLTGAKGADILAIDQSGNLYLYPNTGAGTFGARTQVGSGWSGYVIN